MGTLRTVPTIESKAFTLTWNFEINANTVKCHNTDISGKLFVMKSMLKLNFVKKITSDKSLVLVPKDGTAQTSALAQHFAQTKSYQKKSSNTTC